MKNNMESLRPRKQFCAVLSFNLSRVEHKQQQQQNGFHLHSRKISTSEKLLLSFCSY